MVEQCIIVASMDLLALMHLMLVGIVHLSMAEEGLHLKAFDNYFGSSY